MSNYTKSTSFTVKDSLATGNPAKLVKGTEIDTEYDNIASAVSSKADATNAILLGTATALNLTITGVLDTTISGGSY